ncbi:hypothetical protein L9F63_009626, partial [Diploptera punctata]
MLQALVYRDGGNLVSGSLDALVQHMVPTAEYYPDRAYLFAFLLSSRLFIKPHELLGEVCALCDSQQKLGEKQAPGKERLGRFVPHLVQLLAEWTETFPYDFRDERVMAHVRALTQKCVTIDPGIRKEVSTLLQNLLHRLTALEKYEEFLQRVNSESNTNCVDNLSASSLHSPVGMQLCYTPIPTSSAHSRLSLLQIFVLFSRQRWQLPNFEVVSSAFFAVESKLFIAILFWSASSFDLSSLTCPARLSGSSRYSSPTTNHTVMYSLGRVSYSLYQH